MAVSGKRYTEENYNWDRIKSKYIKLVQDSINNTGFHSVYLEGLRGNG
jgi:hypothetical protein